MTITNCLLALPAGKRLASFGQPRSGTCKRVDYRIANVLRDTWRHFARLRTTARVALEAGYPLALLSVQNEGGAYQHSDFWQGCNGPVRNLLLRVRGPAIRGDHILYDQLGTCASAYVNFEVHSAQRGLDTWHRGLGQLRRDRLHAAHSASFMVANTNYTRDRASRQDKVFESACVFG